MPRTATTVTEASVIADLAEQAATITTRVIDGTATPDDMTALAGINTAVLAIQRDRPKALAKVEKARRALETAEADLTALDQQITTAAPGWAKATR